MKKIRNIGFVRNLIMNNSYEFYYDLSTINMATLPLQTAVKASRKEQRSVIHFLWAKALCPNTIHSEMRPVYGDKCFTRPAIHVCVKSLLVDEDEKVLLMKKDLADVLFQRLMLVVVTCKVAMVFSTWNC